MKYQFQFAGANVSRRSSQPRKRLRIILLVAAFALAVLAYWQYLQHLTHSSRRVLAETKPAAAATATVAATTATAASTEATASTKTSTKVTAKPTESVADATPLAPAAKKASDTAVASADHALPTTTVTTTTTITTTTTTPSAPAKPVEATSTTPIAPAVPTVPATPVAKVTSISSEPAMQIKRVSSEPPRKPRVRTPEERLMRAGMTAFDNMLDRASKYPDSYGFRAQDAFKDATLGKPIPVYTIDESDRAKYQTGQPVKPILKPSDTWMFPVSVGDHFCCMVEVTYTGRDYVPGSGSKLLGDAWNKITERWPASKGYHPCIVVYPDIPGYFFTVPELPTPNMTDIIRLTSFHPSLSPADVILASWR